MSEKVNTHRIWECVKDDVDLAKEFGEHEFETQRLVVRTAHSYIMRRDDLHLQLKTLYKNISQTELTDEEFGEAIASLEHLTKEAMLLLRRDEEITEVIWKMMEPINE